MTLHADRHLWFQGSALEPNGLQAPPAEVDNDVDQLTGSSRRSLDGSAFPGRAWERVFWRWCSMDAMYLPDEFRTYEFQDIGWHFWDEAVRKEFTDLGGVGRP